MISAPSSHPEALNAYGKPNTPAPTMEITRLQNVFPGDDRTTMLLPVLPLPRVTSTPFTAATMPSSCCDGSRGEEELQLCPNFFFLPPLLLLFPLDDTITERPTLPPCWIIVITENSTKNSRTQSSQIHHKHTQMCKIFRKSFFLCKSSSSSSSSSSSRSTHHRCCSSNYPNKTKFSDSLLTSPNNLLLFFFQLEGITTICWIADNSFLVQPKIPNPQKQGT